MVTGCVHDILPDGAACMADGICLGHCDLGACIETAVEVCDGADNDCNGEVDEGFVDTDNEGTADCVDADDDGDGVLDDADCAPLDPDVYPGAEEECGNGIDDDCDPGTPEMCPPASCKELHALEPLLPSGVYPLDPDTSEPLPQMDAFCDMTTDGGGWTLIVRVNGTDAENLLYDAWTAKETLGDTGDFDLTKGSDVLYKSYSTVAGSELMFYDATAACGGDHRLAQTTPVLGEVTLRKYLAELPEQECTYGPCFPPDGPNSVPMKFWNTGCTNPFYPSWGWQVPYFPGKRLGINISMWGKQELLRFTTSANDYDAGFGSKGGADDSYDCGDMDGVVDGHTGWPGHIATIWIR